MESKKSYLTNGDLQAIADLLDKQTAVLATKEELRDLVTKEELNNQTAELKAYTNESFETQQVWMDHRFDELIEKYDVRDRVDKLEKDVRQLKHAH